MADDKDRPGEKGESQPTEIRPALGPGKTVHRPSAPGPFARPAASGVKKGAKAPLRVGDSALAQYQAFLEMSQEKKVLENSLLFTILVFMVLFFVVFPEFAAKLMDDNLKGEVVEVRKQTVIQQEEPEEKQYREVRTEQRERDFSQVPDFSRPTGNERIVEDIDLSLDVRDERTDDIMLGGLPDSAPGPILVAGNIVPPVIIMPDVNRYYPKKASILRRTGKVRVSVVITKQGKLEDIEVLSEDPPNFGFGEAIMKIFRDTRFKPALQNNKPIYARYIFTFQFKLPR